MKRALCYVYIIGLFLILSTLAVYSPPVAAAEKVISLDYSSYFPAGHRGSQLLEQWCREVEKRTNGRVKITFYPGGTLTPASQTFDSVQNGIADIGHISPGYTRGRFPLSEVIELPLGPKNAYWASKMAYEYYKKFKPKELDSVKVLYMYTHGPGILHTRKPVNKLEDLKGMKIRTQGTFQKIIIALGGTPVAMPMTDAYDSLQKGVADGLTSPYEALDGWRLAEVTKYSIEDWGASYPGAFFEVMNKDKWNSLPPDIQKIIEQINEEWVDKAGKVYDEIDTLGKQVAEKRGNKIISLSKAENDRWAKLMQPIFKGYVDEMKKKGLPGDQALKFCQDYLKTHSK